jgi:hypothetical protein
MAMDRFVVCVALVGLLFVNFATAPPPDEPPVENQGPLNNFLRTCNSVIMDVARLLTTDHQETESICNGFNVDYVLGYYSTL